MARRAIARCRGGHVPARHDLTRNVRFVVDLDKVTAVLADPGVTDTFGVVVVAPSDASPSSEASVHRLGDVLAATNVGILDGDGVVRLHPDAVRFHAAGQVDDDWERRFAAACEHRRDRAGTIATTVPVQWPA